MTDEIMSNASTTSHIEELQYLLTLAKQPQTIKLLNEGIRVASEANGTSSDIQPMVKPLRVSATTDKPSVIMCKITNYGWDQSDNYIKIYISDINGLDKVKQDNLKFEFTEKSLSLEIQGLNGRSHSLLINDLLYPIVPSGCGVKAKSNMVIVTLKKSSLGRTWDVLTGREKKIKDSREMKPSKPDKDEDPGVGLMKMMQKLYDEGDDEMKRTIKKAWHESQEKKMKGEDLSV